MFRKTITMITLAAFLFYSFAVSGCTLTSTKRFIVPVDEIKRDTSGQVLNGQDAVKGQIRTVYTGEGAYFFDSYYARIDSATNGVVGSTEYQDVVSLPLATIDSLSVERTSINKKPALIFLGVCVAVGLICVLVAEPGKIGFE